MVVPTILAAFGIVNPSGAGIYKVVIEAEIVHFTSGLVTAGTRTWTVARAQEGTTAVVHLSGTVLKIENTKGAADNAVQLTPTAQQTGTVNVSGAITSGGILTGTGLTAPHAASHNIGGADVLEDLTRHAAGPPMHGYLAWAFDPVFNNAQTIPSAGWIYVTKLLTAHAFTINNIDFYVGQGGTGATALANCFVGIYDSGGTRRFVSADQSSAFASSGAKSLAVSGGYLVTANDFIYIAMLIGTQSTTVFRTLGAAPNLNAGNINLSAATFRFAAQGGGTQTSLPNPTMTLSSDAAQTTATWYGVR